MPRRRRWAGAMAALVLLALVLWTVGPWRRTSSPRATGEGPQDAPSPNSRPPAHLESAAKRTAPTTEVRDARDRVSVEIDASTEDGVPAFLAVFAGAREDGRGGSWRIASGQHEIVEVPSNYLHWFAFVARDDPSVDEYEGAEVHLATLDSGSRVTLQLPRARSVLRVLARNGQGEPVAHVALELSAAKDPGSTRRTTGADGQASWEGFPSRLITEQGIRVVSLPSGYRVLKGPILRFEGGANTDRPVRTAEILVEDCTAGFDLDLVDARWANLVLEMKVGDSWQKDHHVYVEIDPPWIVRSSFGDEGSPRAGRMRCRSRCPGEGRITVFGANGVLGTATFMLVAREITTVRLTPLKLSETARLEGRIVGPAQGVADVLELQVIEAVGDAASLAHARMPLVLRRDGTFGVVLPAGVNRISITGMGKGPIPFAIVPWVRHVATGLEVESRRPAMLRGKFVDGKGQGIPEVSVGVNVLSEQASDRFVVGAGLMLPAVRTLKDGTFTLGPACPGTWRLRIHRPGQPDTFKEVILDEGADQDIGDIALE